MSGGLVVDTSVWIDFFAGRPAGPLPDALAHGRVVLSPVVLAELVSGTADDESRRALLDLLEDLPVHETPREHWLAVGALRRRMSDVGVSVSTPDAHVAQCALDLRAPLLTRDSIFTRIARQTDLRLSRIG